MILGLLQARTSSSRLPGKALLPLAGAPMLAREIERLRRSARVEAWVVATSDRPEDDALAELAEAAGITAFRGSLDDVLDRFYQAAEPHAPEWVVRVTGDCPLIDWDLVDRCVQFAVEGRYEYASNALRPTWPDGLDVEVMTLDALRGAWEEATSPVDREHVTPFIHRQPDRFRLGSMENDTDLSAMRWTVDEPEDYEFVRRVYEALYPANPAFTTADILQLLAAQPELLQMNADIERNAGLKAQEALLKDQDLV